MTTENPSIYDAQRALLELDAERAANPNWATDTAVIGQKLEPLASDDTVPMLPALLRPQV